MSNKKLGEFDRIMLNLRFSIQSPFHLGSGEIGKLTDALVQRRKSGVPYIPGSSLAGILRSYSEELSEVISSEQACTNQSCGTCPVCSLFGYVADDGDNAHGRASRLSIEDAVLLDEYNRTRPEIRQHVGINRFTEAAQSQLQFSNEVAPGGLRFVCQVCIEKPTRRDLNILHGVLGTWREIGLGIGGRTTSGLGNSILEEVEEFGIDFSDSEHLKEYLLGDLPTPGMLWDTLSSKQSINTTLLANLENAEMHAAKQPDYLLPQHVVIDLALFGLQPLLVMGEKSIASTNEREPGAKFVRTTIYKNGIPEETILIPGSSIKGVFRSRLEKIVRTMNYFHGWQSQETAFKDADLAESQYRQRVCACAITHAEHENKRLAACFGTPKEQKRAEKQLNNIYALSCPICQIFGNSMLKGRLFVGDGIPVDQQKFREKLFDNVAIDRFTGGASEARKFDAMPIMPLEGPVFSLRLHLKKPETWILGLLFYLLKDLYDGDIRLGYGKRRGFGQARCVVDHATAYTLPGSDLRIAADKLGRSDLFYPYQKISLPFSKLFSAGSWDEGIKKLSQGEKEFIKDCNSKLDEKISRYYEPGKVFGNMEEN